MQVRFRFQMVFQQVDRVEGTPCAIARKGATSASPLTVGAGTSVGGKDRFLAFNPETDIRVGHFVALSVEQEELRAGVPFYVEKVLEFRRGRWAEKMKMIWYWPCFGIGMQIGSASNIARYENCMEAQWEPSRERHGWVMKEATIFSWGMCQEEPEPGSYMGTKSRCTV
jgi:hypothetical protein